MNINRLAGVVAVSAILFLGLFIMILYGWQIYLSGGWLATWIYIVCIIGILSFYIWGFTTK